LPGIPKNEADPGKPERAPADPPHRDDKDGWFHEPPGPGLPGVAKEPPADPTLPPAGPEPKPDPQKQGRVNDLRRILVPKLGAQKYATPKEREAAARKLGEFGTDAWEARRDLCRALLDKDTTVADSAAGALLKIDKIIHAWAMAITKNRFVGAVSRARELGAFGEPLTPLVIQLAWDNAEVDIVVQEAARALPAIAPKDTGAATFMGAMLRKTESARAWETIIVELRRMEHPDLATGQLLPIATKPTLPEKVRCEAIQTLLVVLDQGGPGIEVPQKQMIKDALLKLNSDRAPKVRDLIRENEKRLR
jgi:hypothetical protein